MYIMHSQTSVYTYEEDNNGPKQWFTPQRERRRFHYWISVHFANDFDLDLEQCSLIFTESWLMVIHSKMYLIKHTTDK